MEEVCVSNLFVKFLFIKNVYFRIMYIFVFRAIQRCSEKYVSGKSLREFSFSKF